MDQKILHDKFHAAGTACLDAFYENYVYMRLECEAMRQAVVRSQQSIIDVSRHLDLARQVIADARNVMARTGVSQGLTLTEFR